MKLLLDHAMKESEEEHQFGYLPEMCCNSPVQLGALTSESFSKRMIITANLIVDTHRLCLNNDMINTLIVLRMNKKFMDRVRSKNILSSMMFDNIESNKIAKVYFLSLFLF